jgi:predicted methyltransferase
MMWKNRLLLSAGALAATLSAAAAAQSPAIPDYITAAVVNSGRPDTDRARDPLRKPAEVLAFAGVKPGDKVADFMPGKGYFTNIFCTLVGPKGHVYAISVKRPQSATPPPADAAAKTAPPPGVASCTNVTRDSEPPEEFAAPEPLDLIWTSENYHDLHNKGLGPPDIAKVDDAFFKALKPGGVLMVEDHVATPGSGIADTSTLHRIDIDTVKKEVTAAGFTLEAESPVLHNPDDPHTAKVFDLHDKTDRFLLKFRKPAH